MTQKSFSPLLVKMFDSNLSGADWVDVLNDWQDRLQWTAPVNDDDHLLSKWSATNIPSEAVLWLLEKQSRSIWSDPSPKGSTALGAMWRRHREGNSPALTALANQLNLDVFDAEASQMLKAWDKEESYAGRPTHTWTGNLGTLVVLQAKGQWEALTAYMKRRPEVRDVQDNGWTAGAMLARTEPGWKSYMAAGGSIFDKVWIDAATGDASDQPTPLWLWLLQKKIYHNGVRTTLDSLMIRLAEDRAPYEGELVLSNEDWSWVVENKTKIMGEMRMISFEKEIETDWKKAIKTNKSWRNWRSSDGAHFLQWMALKKPAEFVSSAVKVKRNKAMFQQTDARGCDVFPYLMAGMLTGDIPYRRQNKVNEKFSGAWSEIKPLIDLNPRRGVFAQWAAADSSGFFGALDKGVKKLKPDHYGGNSTIYQTVLDEPKLFWNGMTDALTARLFSVPEMTERMYPMAASALRMAPEKHVTDIFDQLSPTVRLGLLALGGTPLVLQGCGSDVRTFITKQIEKVISEEHTVGADTLERMLQWGKKHTNSWYYSTPEILSQFQAWMSQQILLSEVRNRPRAEDVITADVVDVAPARKRRM